MMATLLVGMVFVSVCIGVVLAAGHFPIHLVYRAKKRKDKDKR